MAAIRTARSRRGSILEVLGGLLLSFAIIFAFNYFGRQAAPSPEQVFVLSVEGTIGPGLDSYIERGLEEAADEGAKAVVVEIGTLGGSLDTMDAIASALDSSSIDVYTYVSGSAASAGALIALTGKMIAMAPGAAIGAAAPIDQTGETAGVKAVSFVKSKFRAAAEVRRENGHPDLNPEIAEGMVDEDMAIEGLKQPGELISLSAEQARDYDYCDFIVSNRAEALDAFGLGGYSVREFKQMPAERFVRFLMDPLVSSWLLVLGFLGLVIEAFTPGFGVAGTLGLTGLALFFGARILAGLAGFEVIFFFLAGLILLILEVFITPGFGVLGLLGLGSLAGSVILSYNNTSQALASLSGALSVTFLMAFVMLRFLDRRGAFRPILLNTSLKTSLGYTSSADKSQLLGASGMAATMLRPAGVALIDGVRVDVVSEGDFVAKGEKIVVVQVEGARVVVRPSPPGE